MTAWTVKNIVGTAVLAVSLLFADPAANAQGAMQQVTPVVPGHTVEAVQNGLFADGGAAQGGPINTGISEIVVQSRQNGQAPSAANGFGKGPFQATGTGQYNSHDCKYAGSPQSPAGSYYLCLDSDTTANGVSGGVLSYGSIGVAPELPFQICTNGTCLQIPFSGTGSGNVVGVPPTTIGGATCFDNTIATLIQACNPSQAGGPAIAAVLPTVLDAPVCWDNTTGTLLITCPGSGPGGDWQVNTTNGSGVAGFTSFLNLPQNPSFSTSPTGNPTGGGILTTNSTVAVQGNAVAPNNREFLVNLGLTSGTGSTATGNNGDKVTLYSAMVSNAGSGSAWATNFVTVRQSGSTGNDIQTLECDQNNLGIDTGGSDGPTGLPTVVSYCLTTTGVSDANGFTNTAGLGIFSFGGASGSVPLDAHGIIFTGLYKFNDIADYSEAPTYEAVFGSHNYGIDLSQGTITGGAVRIGGTNGSGIVGRNMANTADAQLLTWTGTNELICQTNCSQVASNGPIFAPNFNASVGMTINSLPVPTGVGVANTCAFWTTAGNLSTTACAASTADGTTIVNSAGVLSAIAGPTPQTVSASTSTTTVTVAATSEAVVTLSANTTFTLTAPSPSTDTRLFKLRLVQDGTGSRTVAFDSSVAFGTTVASFTASTAASATDEIGFEWNAALSKWMVLAYALGYP